MISQPFRAFQICGAAPGRFGRTGPARAGRMPISAPGRPGPAVPCRVGAAFLQISHSLQSPTVGRAGSREIVAPPAGRISAPGLAARRRQPGPVPQRCRECENGRTSGDAAPPPPDSVFAPSLVGGCRPVVLSQAQAAPGITSALRGPPLTAHLSHTALFGVSHIQLVGYGRYREITT
jgi:hypothetical protein